jgi:hypothetical protein
MSFSARRGSTVALGEGRIRVLFSSSALRLKALRVLTVPSAAAPANRYRAHLGTGNLKCDRKCSDRLDMVKTTYGGVRSYIARGR